MATYTVRKGDTLSQIAQSQLGAASRWPEIAELNALPTPDMIYPDQTLRLPSTLPDASTLGARLISTIVDWFRNRR